ncbi:unnamed protein product [Arabidopsis thaliana]|uniref:Uncharacterized protein n=1 Tax=Arabidopsis thaliana TaxID=3702 RepID=A0A5S9XHT4_ARATH|nr:unnamed protein product [Arabidopsis thaliana]
MCSYCKKHNDKFVPDPYYGGAQAMLSIGISIPLLSLPNGLPFQNFARGNALGKLNLDLLLVYLVLSQVLDLLEDACESLLDSIRVES